MDLMDYHEGVGADLAALRAVGLLLCLPGRVLGCSDSMEIGRQDLADVGTLVRCLTGGMEKRLKDIEQERESLREAG